MLYKPCCNTLIPESGAKHAGILNQTPGLTPYPALLVQSSEVMHLHCHPSFPFDRQYLLPCGVVQALSHLLDILLLGELPTPPCC